MKNIQLLTFVGALLCTSAFELKAMESESQDSAEIQNEQNPLDSVEIADEQSSPKEVCAVMPASLGKRSAPEITVKQSAQKKFFLDPVMLAQELENGEQQLKETQQRLEAAQDYLKNAGLQPIEVSIRNTAPSLSKEAKNNLRAVGIELPQSKSSGFCSLI